MPKCFCLWYLLLWLWTLIILLGEPEVCAASLNHDIGQAEHFHIALTLPVSSSLSVATVVEEDGDLGVICQICGGEFSNRLLAAGHIHAYHGFQVGKQKCQYKKQVCWSAFIFCRSGSSCFSQCWSRSSCFRNADLDPAKKIFLQNYLTKSFQ